MQQDLSYKIQATNMTCASHHFRLTMSQAPSVKVQHCCWQGCETSSVNTQALLQLCHVPEWAGHILKERGEGKQRRWCNIHSHQHCTESRHAAAAISAPSNHNISSEPADVAAQQKKMIASLRQQNANFRLDKHNLQLNNRHLTHSRKIHGAKYLTLLSNKAQFKRCQQTAFLLLCDILMLQRWPWKKQALR